VLDQALGEVSHSTCVAAGANAALARKRQQSLIGTRRAADPDETSRQIAAAEERAKGSFDEARIAEAVFGPLGRLGDHLVEVLIDKAVKNTVFRLPWSVLSW
jgi:hypothetical protein